MTSGSRDMAPPLTPLNAEARPDQLFPTLTPEQLARISEQGTRRELHSGEVVYEAGAEEVPFVVVIAGELQTIRPSEAGDTVITGLGPGQFTGEANMLSGHRPLVRVLATEPSHVLELTLRMCSTSCRPCRTRRNPHARVHFAS